MQKSDSFNLNNVTLECFSKCKLQTATPERRTLSRQQKNFYRKRILASTKELARGKCGDDSLKAAYDAYAAQLIEHYRAADKSFLVQQQFSGMPCRIKEKQPLTNYRPDDALFTDSGKGIDSYVVRRRVRKKKEHVRRVKQINLEYAQFRNPRKDGV